MRQSSIRFVVVAMLFTGMSSIQLVGNSPLPPPLPPVSLK